MEKEHQDDVHEDVVSQEDSQSTESIINQQTFTATCPLPTDIPTYCSYDYNFLPNVKCEQILPENMPEDKAGCQQGSSVDGLISTGLQSVKCEGQRTELNEQQTIHPIMDTDSVLMKSCIVNELTDMKPEKNADPSEYGRTSSETRHWVVCHGGVLKEVKPEHTHGVSEIVPVEDFCENVDNIQYWSGTNDAKVESESQLSVRETQHTGVKHLIGDTFGKSFNHPNDLENRERSQTIIAKPFSCDACGKSFPQRKSLIRHERIHSGVKPFTCDKCGKSFGRSSILKEHERIHSDVKPFTCDTCGKSFRHAGTLRLHERIHTGIKPFTCDACGKSFIRVCSLRVHKRKHSGVKPFTCDTCGKSFTHAAALIDHERIHTRVKPFTCEACGKSFTRPGALREHERIHTGVKPFTCDICGKQFSRSGGLKARWQNTHRCEHIHL